MSVERTTRYPARIFVAFALTAFVAGALASTSVASPAAASTCKGALVTKVTQGPDSGLMLKGTYTLHLAPSGAFSGTLSDKTGAVPMNGQINGIAVNWVFTLSGDRHLYVSGTSLQPLTTCAAKSFDFWGVATGPRFGDLGVWAGITKDQVFPVKLNG